MDNLSTFLKLQKLVNFINHGKASIDFKVRAGKITEIVATGTKKTRYNSSKNDTNNNQTAIRHILGRIADQLNSESSSEVVFKIRNNKNKIISVEIESESNILG